jgi:hypothetical protein
MNAIPLVLVASLLAGLAFYVLRAAERYRADAIRTLASRHGMHYLGDAVPKSVSLKGTPFHGASRVWNMIDGEPRGTRVMAFDCQVGEGKRSWRRTVIAVESDNSSISDLPLGPDMTTNRSGPWQILYRPKICFSLSGTGLSSVEELEANLDAVLADSAKARC